MQKKPPPISPLIAIPFGILAVSTSSIFIRYAQAYASSLSVAAFRLSFAVLILSPLVLLRHRKELKALTKKELGLALLSGGLLAIHFGTWITSLEYTTVASSVVLVSTAPLWVALLSPVFLGEKISRYILIGMTLALLGGTIVGLSDSCTWTGENLLCPSLGEFVSGTAFLGDMLALAGALTGGGYLMIGRRLRKKLSLVPYIFVVYGMAAVTLCVALISLEGVPTGYPPQVYLWFVLLALVPQLLGHSTFNWALRYLSAAYVSITLLGEPIGSTILAYFFLQEKPTSLKLFGAILILVGIYIASSRRQAKIHTPQKEQT
ncbi:MAG: putative cystine transporter YijE [Chloroflexi bacterium]|nr:putative cystine transporter YijE [Chloroflexota bacterium]